MKGDFTRDTFRQDKHYSSVRMQQGRVQLDADWNEQLDIQAYIDRITHTDVIGKCGGPMGVDANGHDLAGFKLGSKDSKLVITKGRYYVDGILIENEATTTLTQQPDLPDLDLSKLSKGVYLAYLDVWERHITALEDPELREVALGGPDTTTRTRVVWQVKLEDAGNARDCSAFGPDWGPKNSQSTGLLSARAEPDPDSDDPCIVPADAGYRRLENQLYRVEIHKPGPVGTATYKWSRENGSIVTRWETQDGNNLVVSTVGKDEVLRFSTGDWVELTDDTRELHGKRGVLVQLNKVEDLTLTMNALTINDPDDPSANSVDINKFPRNPKIRRWESKDERPVTIAGGNDGYLKLEKGVEIRFKTGGMYQTGDYWMIPARVNTGNVIWECDETTNQPAFLPAHGIHHHYCGIGVVAYDGKEWQVLDDCRKLFPPLTEIDVETCCTVSVGDGLHSIGKFRDIQEAIDSLDAGPGTVCVLPGMYELEKTVVIRAGGVRVEGCNRQARILGPPGEPAFLVVTSQNVGLEGLAIRADAPGGAVRLERGEQIEVVNCVIINRPLNRNGEEEAAKKEEEAKKEETAKKEAVLTEKKKELGMTKLAPEEEKELVRRIEAMLAEEKLERKTEVATQIASPMTLDKSKEVLMALKDKVEEDQMTGPALHVEETRGLRVEWNLLYGTPAAHIQTQDAMIAYNKIARGGVWVMDGSSQVTLRENHVFRGLGPGVALGGLPKGMEPSKRATGVRQVEILGNRIYFMAASGISTVSGYG